MRRDEADHTPLSYLYKMPALARWAPLDAAPKLHRMNGDDVAVVATSYTSLLGHPLRYTVPTPTATFWYPVAGVCGVTLYNFRPSHRGAGKKFRTPCSRTTLLHTGRACSSPTRARTGLFALLHGFLPPMVRHF